MLRKLVLVGLVLLVGRGTVAQLAAAIILSFGFFALQMIVRATSFFVLHVCRPANLQPVADVAIQDHAG